jgi:hypothetical protein
MAQLNEQGKRNGQPGHPKPGQPRTAVASSLASLAAPLAKAPSAVSVHAKEIMAQLIPMRQNYEPAAIAEEAFSLARAFAAEESRDVVGGLVVEPAATPEPAGSADPTPVATPSTEPTTAPAAADSEGPQTEKPNE